MSNKKFLDYFFLYICIYFISISIGYGQGKEYIVKFKSLKDISKYQIQSKNLTKLFNIGPKIKNLQIQNYNNFIPDLYFKINSSISNTNFIKELSKDINVDFIEENHIYHIEKNDFPNDSFAQFQWALKAINADKTWTKANGEGIIVGIVDTGIDFEHEDLKNQLWINKMEDANGNGTFEPWSVNEIINGISGDFDGIDNDKNGYIDDVIGYDLVDQTYANFGDWSNPDPIPEDEGRHGTGVAGVIAAEGNNNKGIIGVAYKCKILTARVFDATGNAESDDIASGIIYAAMNGAKIINMSFGDNFESLLLRDAINFASSLGCILVASSGNENNGKPHFPSDFDNVISVGASKINDLRSSISNFGVNLSLLAPGEDILTCETGNSYSRLSGTSFSAPYVSAACALLLQLSPNLTYSEIRSTLEATAKKIDANGWNKFSGAGILDLESLLNSKGLSNFEIYNFPNYSFVNQNDLSQFINVNVRTPLFQSWQVEYSSPDSSIYHTLMNSNLKQTEKNEVFPLDFSGLKNDFILSLKIVLKNGQILRRQKYLREIFGNNSLNLNYFAVNSALQNGKRVYVISAETNFPSYFWVEFSNLNNPSLKFRKDEEIKYSNDHLIVLNDLLFKGNFSGRAYFALRNSSGDYIDTVSKDFNFENIPQIYPTSNYTEKSYSLPRAYINNYVDDLYFDGKKSIIINNMEDFLIGNSEVYEFSDNKFKRKDTLKDWIPVDYGDTRGFGNREILLTQNGRTEISTYISQGDSPFSNVIFSSILGKTFWGEGLFDIDKDGKSEILAYNDTTYFVYKFLENKFSLLKNLDTLNKKGVTKGSAVGDFDGDGNIEIFHSNYYGNLFIYEYKNAEFNLEWSDTTNYGYSNPVVTKINLPGDSKPSIIIGTFGSNILFNKEENFDVIWSYRIIKSEKSNTYNVSNFENILGVRAGIEPRLKLSFRNGVASGNLDNESGDELVISAFPNTYVMKWTGKQFEPFWQYKYSFTNSAVIFDFDKNGTNEIGISTYDSTRFFELSPKSGKSTIPIIYDSYALNENEAILKWYSIPSSQRYKIYELKALQDGTYSVNYLTESVDDSIKISNLKNNTFNYYLVTSVDTSKTLIESDFSELQTIFTHKVISPQKVKVNSRNIIQIIFDGKISKSFDNMSDFSVYEENNNDLLLPTSAQALNYSILSLTFSNSLPTGKYFVQINSIRDFWNSPTNSGNLNFEILDSITEKELFLTSLEIFSPTLYKLSFSEPLEKNSCEIPTNYEINPWGKVLIASFNDSESVFLRLDDQIAKRNITGEWYSITARNILAESGHKMTNGPGNTLSFVLTKDKLESVIAFPDPFSLSKDEFLRFGNLSKESTIQIMDLNGKELYRLSDKSGNGGISWDLKDFNGNKLQIGLYIFKVTGKNTKGEEILWEMKKFAVIP